MFPSSFPFFPWSLYGRKRSNHIQEHWREKLWLWLQVWSFLRVCSSSFPFSDVGVITQIRWHCSPPWLWCSLDPLCYVFVQVLYLCPHSLLCEFFEQLIASVEKKIKTRWIFLVFQSRYHVKENLMCWRRESSIEEDKDS